MKLSEGARVLLVGAKCKYNLEYFTFSALKSLGYQVEFYGYYNKLGKWEDPVRIFGTRSRQFRKFLTPFVLRDINKNLVKTAIKEKPDLILVIKGEIISPEALRELKTLGYPLALWFPDDPRYTNSYVKHVINLYDNVYVVSKETIKLYAQLGAKRVHYLPMACDPLVHNRIKPDELKKGLPTHNVCFIGTFSRHRAEIIKSLSKFQVNVWGSFWWLNPRIRNKHPPVYGPEMVKVYNASKIVLNIHDPTDYGIKTNMRLFEATGSGAFVLSDGEKGLKDLFEPKKEEVCYENSKDIVELVDYFLANPSERSKIATLAYNRAHTEHTYVNRVQNLLHHL